MPLLVPVGVFSEIWSVISPMRVATACGRLGELSGLASSSAPGLMCSPSRAFRASATEEERQVQEVGH